MVSVVLKVNQCKCLSFLPYCRSNERLAHTGCFAHLYSCKIAIKISKLITSLCKPPEQPQDKRLVVESCKISYRLPFL